MKIVLIGMMIFSLNSFAGFMGGTLKDSKTQDHLGLVCVDTDCRYAVFTKNDVALESNLELDLSDYQETYYHFNMIIQVASTSRPPIPQMWHIVNMQKVTRILRKALPLMHKKEAFGQMVEMDHKNFLEVIKAIQSY
jgi:hypothetical protein